MIQSTYGKLQTNVDDPLGFTVEGHDGVAYEITKTYIGGSFVHIAQGRTGINGAIVSKHMPIHIDELDAVIQALQRLRDK